jgi:flavoprotein
MAAKFASGIADSLTTGCIAQTTGSGTSVYLCPVDEKPGGQLTDGPNGEQITIVTRRVDPENVGKLRRMEGITVLGHALEIEPVAQAALNREAT